VRIARTLRASIAVRAMAARAMTTTDALPFSVRPTAANGGAPGREVKRDRHVSPRVSYALRSQHRANGHREERSARCNRGHE